MSLGADARLIPSAAEDAALNAREARADQGGAWLNELRVARVNARAAVLIALRDYVQAINGIASEVGALDVRVEDQEGQLDDLLGELEFSARDGVERFIEGE